MATSEIKQLVLRQPDDWHVHLRDGAMLGAVANHTARQFARAIVMPNLSPPVTSVAAAAAYRDRIIAAVDPAYGFTPLMTAYLTDSSDGAELARGHAEGVFTAAKLYPANATTNSSFGVTRVAALYPALEAMQKAGMPLLVHGEVTDRDIDIFDREAVFIDRVLAPLLKDFPGLKAVFEHITTRDAAQYVRDALRPIDIVARFGGEEFVVLLPSTQVDEAQKTLTRLQRQMSASLFMHEGKDVLVTFSAGVTAYRFSEALGDALERADEALYEAKRTGKNRTCIA